MNTTTPGDTACSETPAASDTDEPRRTHVVARAHRMRAVHLQGPDGTCCLCLSAWPCPPRTWADRALR